MFNIGDSSTLNLAGENRKSLLIVLEEREAQNVELKAFLSKILAAIKYDIDKDVVIISLDDDSKASLSSMYQKTNANTVITFGFKASDLGFFANIRNYVFTEIDAISFLFCDNLTNIAAQNNLKAALWDALKNKLL